MPRTNKTKKPAAAARRQETAAPVVTAASRAGKNEEEVSEKAETMTQAAKTAAKQAEEVKVEEESKQKAGEEEDEEEECCAVCMDTASLQPHQCKVCKPDAWVICTGCDKHILSRECPLCRAPYAPRLFYQWPFEVDFSSKEARAKPENNLVQLKVVSDSFAVWQPKEQAMTFSLPQDCTLPPSQIRFVKCSLPLPAGIPSDGVFTFVSSTWDALENQIEEKGGGELCNLKEMLSWFCNAIVEPEAVLFTTMNPEEIASLDFRLDSHLQPRKESVEQQTAAQSSQKPRKRANSGQASKAVNPKRKQRKH